MGNNKKKNKLQEQPSLNNSNNTSNKVYEGLSDDELKFHNLITVDYKSINPKKPKEISLFVNQCISILENHDMIIIKNAFPEEAIDHFNANYKDLLDFNQFAIGEKDATKRSGTRFYNCSCQLGPKCSFRDWKEGGGRK